MPGASRLGYALDDVAVLHHDVMGRHFAAGRAEFGDRILAVGHAGVMQHQHVGPGVVPALAMVRRRSDLGDDAGIRPKLGHQQDHTRKPHALEERRTQRALLRSRRSVNDCAESMAGDKVNAPPESPRTRDSRQRVAARHHLHRRVLCRCKNCRKVGRTACMMVRRHLGTAEPSPPYATDTTEATGGPAVWWPAAWPDASRTAPWWCAPAPCSA